VRFEAIKVVDNHKTAETAETTKTAGTADTKMATGVVTTGGDSEVVNVSSAAAATENGTQP